MTVHYVAHSADVERASATLRLVGAREHLRRLRGLVGVARRAGKAPIAPERLSAARARVASRRAWLHWVDEGTSFEPWADGEWAPRTPRRTMAPRRPSSLREPARAEEHAHREAELAHDVAGSGTPGRASDRLTRAAVVARRDLPGMAGPADAASDV